MNLKLCLNMPTINFFIRSNNDKAGTSVLYCRVRLNDTVTEFSLKEKIEKKYWCQVTASYKGKNKEQNKYLETVIDSIRYKLKSKAVCSVEQMTAKQLVESLSDNKQTPSIKLSEICQQYIEAFQNVMKPATYKNHNVKLKNLQEFSRLTKTDYTAEQFTVQTASDFIEWFCTKNRTKNVTSANRNVLFYKMCCKWYRKKGNKLKTELFEFDGEKDKIQAPVFLSAYELNIVRTTIFASDYLSRIRDLFLFQCYTGLSYCDLWSEWNIKHEEFGIIMTGIRGKNNQSFWLPVEDDIVLKILSKYNNVLPRYENQVYNRILKEIGMICGIDKRITTHTARKTFATQMDANGWSRETVSKMLGHTSVKTTELYYLGHSFARLENEYRQRKNAV